MKINKIFTALAAMAMLCVASCTKMSVEETEVYLEVNASNLHGNWELVSINDEPAAANFYINFDRSGEIAGSKLTLEVACRNVMKHTGASIVDVFRYASYNPSRAVGFTDRGEIRKGLKADLVICDHWMNVKTVVREGEIVK